MMQILGTAGIKLLPFGKKSDSLIKQTINGHFCVSGSTIAA